MTAFYIKGVKISFGHVTQYVYCDFVTSAGDFFSDTVRPKDFKHIPDNG